MEKRKKKDEINYKGQRIRPASDFSKMTCDASELRNNLINESPVK